MSTHVTAVKKFRNEAGEIETAEEKFPKAVWDLLGDNKNGWKVKALAEAEEAAAAPKEDAAAKKLKSENDKLKAELEKAQAALVAATAGTAKVVQGNKPPLPPAAPEAPADQTPAAQ